MEKNQLILTVVIAAIAIVAAAAIIVSLNGNGGNDNSNDDTEKITDATNNVTVFDGQFPKGTVLETSILSGSERDAVVNLTPTKIIDHESAVAYNIEAKSNGKVVEPETLVEVVIKNPFSGGAKVYSVNDGRVVQLYSYTNGDELRFHSNNLGNFVIGVAPASNTEDSITDSTTGVTVNNGGFPEGTVLEANLLSGSDRDDAVRLMPTFLIDHSTAVAYDIHAKCNGSDVDPSSTMEVVMKNPFPGKANLLIHAGSLIMQLYPTSNGDELKFETSSFGQFVIGEAPASNAGDSITDSTTGVSVNNGGFPEGTVLEVTPLSGSDRDDAVRFLPTSVIDHESAVAYRIVAKYNGETIQPANGAEVVLKNPFPNSATVFSVNDGLILGLFLSENEEELGFYTADLGNFVIGTATPSNSVVSIEGQGTTFSVNGGDFTGNYSSSLASGTSVTVLASPDDGYLFDGYYVNGSKVSDDLSYTFTVGSSGTSIKVVSTNYSAQLVIEGGNSTVYVNEAYGGKHYETAVMFETPVTAYAVADEGYIVTGWTGTFSSDKPVCNFTFKSATTLYVQTEAVNSGTSKVHVTTSLDGETADSYGSIIAHGQNVGNEYAVTLEESGASIQLSAEAEAGFAFHHWDVDGKFYSGRTMNVTVGTDDMEIIGVFVPAATHTLTATIDNGTVQMDGETASSKLVKEGVQTVLKAVPADGYRFVGWYYDGKCISTSEEHTVTMQQADMAFEAKTQSTVLNVNLSVTNGTIEVNGTNVGSSYSSTIGADDTIVFEALANEGYVFNTWTMNGKTYNANKITVTGVSDDITATATMVHAAARTVLVSADYGTVSIDGVEYGNSGSIQAYDGKEVTINVEVPYGYMLRGWTYDDKYVTTEASYTFKVYGDMVFKAVAESTLHTLTVKSVNGGLIINSANIGSEYTTQLYTGESLIVNAAPSAGNTFSEWDVNGKKYGASYQTIEIRMGSEDIVATAYNVPMEDGTLHITATNGTVKVGDKDVGDSYDIKADPKSEYTLTAVPRAGYMFDHWVLDGETSEYQVVTVTMGTEHVNAEAVMVKKASHTVTASIDHGTLVYNNVEVGSKYTVVVDDKTVFTISAKPLTGYALTGWYVNGEGPHIETEYQFEVNSDTDLVMTTIVKPVYQ